MMIDDENIKVAKCRDDRISNLPDDILVDILSLLPMKEAAQTSLISRKWIDLWKYTSNIIFKLIERPNTYFEYIRYKHSRMANKMESSINLVNLVLKLHKAPILKEFKVELDLMKSKQHHVGEWLEYAFSKGVERMDLHLGCDATDYLYYDRNVDSSDHPVFDEKMVRSITRSSSFKSCLKVFCLRCVEVNGDAISLLVRHCKLLERLMIYRSKRRSDVEIGGTLSLKHLDLRSRKNNLIEENYNIRVCAPNLTWLTVDQNSERVLLDNVPKLVHMNFYCRPRYGDSMFHFANAAAQLQTLIIHISDPMVRFTVPEMPKLKKLVIYVRTIFFTFVPLPVSQFLSASPCLEELKIEISEILVGAVPQFASTPDIFEIPKVGEGCGHKQLKVFVLSGYCGVEKIEDFEFGHCKTSLELVRYIVKNCVRLEEIVVGQCDRVGLVRDIVDYGDEPLHNYFIKPAIDGHYRFAATPDQRQAFQIRMQQEHIPPHIKLRLVYDDATAPRN